MKRATRLVLDGPLEAHPYAIEVADCRPWLAKLPPASVDLIFGSPPYEGRRTYGALKFDLRGEAFVAWMVDVFELSLRACRGLVAYVIDGETHRHRYSAVPFLILADLVRKGYCPRHPAVFFRKGIPGGSPDFLAHHWEPIICFTAQQGRLPFACPQATGHPPVYGPGGALTHRLTNGQRKARDCWGSSTDAGGGARRPDGKRQKKERPSHRRESKHGYQPPKFCKQSNVIHCKVGGGHMGCKLATEVSEAPFPELLPEIFIRCFCPPGGIVCDPFTGSGTTAAIAHRWGRRFVGCDARPDQVAGALRRVAGETPFLSAFVYGDLEKANGHARSATSIHAPV